MKQGTGKTNLIRKFVPVLLVLSMAFGPLSLAGGLNGQPGAGSASAKHETIFARLDYHGNVADIYAVNTFIEPAAELVDYGSYVNLVNLTSQAEPLVEGERITFPAHGDEPVFRYQGTLENRELPWEFRINYYLDGKPIAPENLAGAAGRLRLELEAGPNPRHTGDFAENFTVQLSVSLEMDKATAITAPAATKKYVGNTVALAFTLLPGNAASFYLEADVRNFRMEGINIAALEAALPGGDPLADLESGFAQLAEGMEELGAGTAQIHAGMVDLDAGVERLYGGLAGIDSGGTALREGMAGYAAGLKAFAEGMNALGSGSAGFNDALSGMAAALPRLSDGYGQVEGGVNALLAQKAETEQLALALAQSSDPQVRMLAEALLGQLAGLAQVQEGLKKANEGLAAHSGALSKVAAQYAQFNRGLQESMEGAGELPGAFNGITAAANNLFDGIKDVKDGAAVLKQNTAALPEALQKLADGQNELQDGAVQAGREVTEFMEGGTKNETVSFVSPGKANAKSVQFVLLTPPVEAVAAPVAEIDDAQTRNIWQRFLDLFRQLAQSLRITDEIPS